MSWFDINTEEKKNHLANYLYLFLLRISFLFAVVCWVIVILLFHCVNLSMLCVNALC